MLNLLINSINAIRSVSGLDSDASAFITAAGLTDPTQKSAINTLVKDMKAAGLWTKMKAVYPMVGGTATSMKFNLKDPRDLDAAFRLTWSGGWTYSATGAIDNSVNGVADTKFNPTSNWNNDNYSFGTYTRNELNGDFNPLKNNTSFRYWPRNAGTAYFDAVYPSRVAASVTSSKGLFYLSRNTLTEMVAYRNATKLGINTTSTPNLISANMTLGNSSGFEISFAYLSTSLTDQDSQLLNQIVEKYQVALSRGVQAAQSFYYNSAYSNEANTYLYSTQITGTTQVSAINTLINGLKANNLWTKMKAVYPFVTDKTLQADMAAQMKFNLVNPQDSDAAFRLAFSGGWTYSTNGAQPNGTNGWANTNLNPVGLINGTNSHMSYYSRTDNDGLYADLGHGGAMELLTRFGNVYYADYPDSTRAQTANASSLGNFIISNTSAGGKKVFKNASTLISSAFVNTNFSGVYTVVIANYNNLVPARYSNRQFSFVTIGDGLTDTEAALLYSLVQQYQTDLSRQV
jgi:hypothetical protein